MQGGFFWGGEVTMVNLDNLTIYQQLDTSGMLDHLHEFPEQCRQAWEKVLKFDLPREYSKFLTWQSNWLLNYGGT